MTATATIAAPSDLLRVADLTATQLNALLDLADEMKDGPTWWGAARTGGAVGVLFEEPSAPTRASFELAAQRLGMRAVPLPAGERALSGYAAIVVSASSQETVQEIARAAPVPVVNALTDDHDPVEALADLLTLRRWFGYLDGLRLAYVGDGGSIAHSLMEAGALAGMHVAIATPPGREPDHDVTMGALALAEQHGGSIQLGHDPGAAIADADVVYTGGSATVDDALIRRRAPEAVLMHALPGYRGLEVIAQATLHTLTRAGAMSS